MARLTGVRFRVARRLPDFFNFVRSDVNMKCQVHRLGKQSSSLAARHLLSGDVIAVPTDTVYGVACLVQNGSAVGKLYGLKGRHPDKPVAVCLADVDAVRRWAAVDHVDPEMMSRLLPGPVTLCFERTPLLNPDFNPGVRLVGIRVPDSAFVRDICRKVDGAPVALTSANVSSSASCLAVEEFLPDLIPRGLDAAFDGGRLCRERGDEERCRSGSTIVDLSVEGSYSVIRTGSAYKNTTDILEQFGLKKVE